MHIEAPLYIVLPALNPLAGDLAIVAAVLTGSYRPNTFSKILQRINFDACANFRDAIG
jgi:hypothetical protein